MYKVIDKVTGEIIESSIQNAVIKDAHNRMNDYKETYKKEFYLEYKGNGVYELKEYVVGYKGQYSKENWSR